MKNSGGHQDGGCQDDHIGGRSGAHVQGGAAHVSGASSGVNPSGPTGVPSSPPPPPPPPPQLLLDAVNISDAHGGTPLLYACRLDGAVVGSAEKGAASASYPTSSAAALLVSRLAGLGASVSDCALRPSGNGPLHLAALRGDAACTRELVRGGGVLVWVVGWHLVPRGASTPSPPHTAQDP